MNKIQEFLGKLYGKQPKSKEWHDQYNISIDELLKSDQIYTIVKRDGGDTQGLVPIFCGLGNDKIPSMWLFSTEQNAKDFIEYYNFNKNPQCKIETVTTKQIADFTFNAIFAGVENVLIDEGKHCLITNVNDIVNHALVLMKKKPALNTDEFSVVKILNRMKYAGLKVFVVPGKNQNTGQIMDNKFVPYDVDKCIKIYTEDEKCKIYSKSVGFENEFTVDLNYYQLNSIINQCIAKGIKKVSFIKNSNTYNVDMKMLIYILNNINNH